MRFQGEVQDTYTQYLPVFMYNRYIGLFFSQNHLRASRILMDKKIADREEIRKNIQNIQAKLRLLGVKSLALFGSASRNEAVSGSDIDFLVDFERPYTFDRYMDVKLLLEDLLLCDVDLVTPDAVRPELKDNVNKDLYRVA